MSYSSKERETSVDQRLKHVVLSLQKTDKELAIALKKWSPRILSSVYALNQLTQKDTNDLLQDFMVRVSQASYDHKREQYRINGKLYEIHKKEGQFVTLIRKTSLKSSKENPSFVYSSYQYLAPIKKASLSSLIYRVIHQTHCDILQHFYSKKNGFKEVGEEEKVVKVRGKGITGVEKKKTKVIECMKKEFSIHTNVSGSDDPEGITFLDVLYDVKNDVEKKLEAKNLVDTFYSYLSEQTQKVMNETAMTGKLNSVKIAKKLNMTRRQMEVAKVSAVRAWDMANNQHYDFKGKKPMYFTPEQICN